MPNTVSLNRNLIDLEYAVRGPLAIRAAELVKQGRDIILCNLGNPQALGQKPITFYRQILSLLEYPEAIINERKKRKKALEIRTRLRYPKGLANRL